MRKSLFLLNIAIILSICSSAWSVGEGLGPMAPAMNMPGQPGYSDPGRSNQLEYRQRDGQDPKIQTAVEDIKSRLSSVLKLVNEANAPSAAEMGDIEKTIKSNLGYASKMSSTEKAYYHTLAAWYNYFNNQLKKARASAMAAFQADKNEINARITLIAMSIANDDTRSLKSAATMIKPQNAQGNTFNDPTQMQMPQSQLGTTLDFNADSIIPGMLGTKVAIGNPKCINGTTLNPTGKNVYIVVWSLASIGEAGASTDQAPGMMGMGGMPGGMGGYSSGQQVAPMQAFANVFQQHFASANVAFLGINTDATEAGAKVMGVLAKNAWPWAQAMANDTDNTGLALFTKAKLASPMLVATSPDGTVIYAGSPGGVLPRILAAKVASGTTGNIESAVKQYTKDKPADAAQKALTEANSAPAQKEPSTTAAAPATSTDSNNATTADTTTTQSTTATEAAAADEPQVKAHKSEEETFNPQASQLYEQARGQMKTAKYTGYRNVVEMCRTVIREYPETTEAEKCRQLLREIPAAKRQQFRVTNEEMGQ